MIKYPVGELGQTKSENFGLPILAYSFSTEDFPRDIYQKTMLQEADMPSDREIKEALGAIREGTSKIIEKSGLKKEKFYEKIKFDTNDIREYIAGGLAEGCSIKKMQKETLYKIKQRWKAVKPKSRLGELFYGQTLEEPEPKKAKPISDEDYWKMNKNFFSEAKDWIKLPGQTEINQKKLLNLGLYEASGGSLVKVKDYDEKIKGYSRSERREINKLENPSFWKRHPNFKKAMVIGLSAGFILPLAGCFDRPDTTGGDPDDNLRSGPHEYNEDDTVGDIPPQDTDGDGMSDLFENKSDLYDPLVKNDRYVILVDSYWNSILPEWCAEEYGKQYDFFNNDMKIPEENIYRINHTEPGWSSFKEAVKNISKRADRNDFLFVALTGEGGSRTFTFNQNVSAWNNEPRKVSYEDINKELNKILTKAQYIQLSSCKSSASIKEFLKTTIPRVSLSDTNETACGGSFDLIRSIYPSVLSGKIKFYYEYPGEEEMIKTKDVPIQPDKDKNGFVSVKEAFENARDVYFYGKHPDIPEELRTIHRHPHISDPNNIADELYLGDYPVED
ncbi:MAG: hypothetical protein JSV92_03305 [archaeon]|nr:MAG: hypothetical protein JSV92_03305 [archaeon]